MTALFALVLAPALLQQPVPKSDPLELLQNVIARVKDAKSVRVVTTATLVGHPQGPRETTVELLLRGANEFRLVTKLDGHLIRIKCDGKNILNSGGRTVDPKTFKPEDAMKWMRSRAALSASLAMDYQEPSILDLGIPEIAKASFDGEEKVGGVSAKIVAYELPFTRGRSLAHRAWIDPEKLVVLKREARMGPMTMQESISVMEYDVDCGDEFAMQSKAELNRAMQSMVVKSAQLFASYTGRPPERLEDLDSKPARYSGFWPEGGFWIGGRKPAALGGQEIGKPAAHPLVAPPDRLAKLFSAHVRIRLLKAAADAYEAAYWKLPMSLANLSRKPMDSDVWPEGGFVGDEAAFNDPWGKPFEYAIRKSSAVFRSSGGTILEVDLTAEERTRWQEEWRPFLSAPRAVTYNDGPGRPMTNEAAMQQNLSIILQAQKDMVEKDFDKDEKANYWIRDVAGLFAEGRGELAAPWLNLAKADVTPGRRVYPALKDQSEPDPFYDAYLLASLKHWVDDDGKRQPYDDGTGRHAKRFGIVAYPELYGVSARLTYILSESGKWSKDLKGGEIDALPKDPEGEGWIRVP